MPARIASASLRHGIGTGEGEAGWRETDAAAHDRSGTTDLNDVSMFVFYTSFGGDYPAGPLAIWPRH